MSRTPDGTSVLVPLVVSRPAAGGGDPHVGYHRALAGWLSQYKARTRGDYERIITAFEAWCRGHSLHPFDVRRDDIQEWALELERRGLMLSTQCHYIIVVQSFYRYATDEEHLERNPAARVKRPKFDDSDVARPYMSRPEAARFLAASEQTRPKFRARDHALACVLVLNGLRVSEVCALNVETMSGERGHQTIVVDGKGSKIATAPLAPVTYWALVNYIGDRTEGPVFLGGHGGRMCPAIVRRRVLAIAK
ncbi:MAG: tyrosine-type recombinase/integrase, partial [Actinomycetota bacterium]|nr:tyrosine-type recombinase/integrase [Actinomycetota bacterium]